MAEFLQRHAQLLDELGLFFQRGKQCLHLGFADIGVGQHLRHLAPHLVAGGGLLFQNCDPVRQSKVSICEAACAVAARLVNPKSH